ncbi:hypothetical protein ACIRBY_25135 [Streptomyces sp. NPDC096136]|uniref:hypothetical protein n=1 Tax=Streptomyces sp. NPDC096136 TaxID=3366076 RepID=UPI003810E809
MRAVGAVRQDGVLLENEDTGDWIAADWGTPGWGIQGFAVTAVPQGLIGGSGVWCQDALRAIERTGRYVAGTWEPVDGEDGPRPTGEGSWTGFIGQTGPLALRGPPPRPARPGAGCCSTCWRCGRKARSRTPRSASAPASSRRPT